MRTKFLLPLCAAFLLPSCGKNLRDIPKLPNLSVFELDIAQGNIIAPRALAGLRKGMQKSQVKVLLGTPMVADPFHADRWDYPYSLSHDDTRDQRSVSLYFVNDGLDRIEGDVVGNPRLAAVDAMPVKTTVVVPQRPAKSKPGLLGRLASNLPLLGDEPDPTGTDIETFKRSKPPAPPKPEAAPEATPEAETKPLAITRFEEGGATPPIPETVIEATEPKADPAVAEASVETEPQATPKTEPEPELEPGLFDGLLERIGL